MDNLTHSLTGVFLSRAGLNRLTPEAGWILVVSANVPDADIVSLAWGPLRFLDWHRHLTHSLTAAPALALLSILLVRLVVRRPIRWLGAFLAAMIGVSSHLALDWTNMYGTRLLLPYGYEWLHGDIFSVVDIWVWAVFLLCVAAPMLSRLVGSEIGVKRQKYPGTGFAWVAMLFLLGFFGLRFTLHERAIAILDARIYAGESPLRVAAFPTPTNPLRWKGMVETSAAYTAVEVDVRNAFDPLNGTVYYKAADGPLLDAARKLDEFYTLQGFAQYPLWRTAPAADPPNATRVELLDLRFGTPAEPGFMSEGIFDQHLRPIRTQFTFGPVRPR